MDIKLCLYCFFSVLLASICKGMVGFGDPLISNPLLSMVLSNSVITPGQVPVSLILNSKIVWQNRAYFSWKLIFPISVFVLLGIIPGVYLLRYGSPAILKFYLGLVIIFSGIEMLTRKSTKVRKPNPVVRSAISFFSGLTGMYLSWWIIPVEWDVYKRMPVSHIGGTSRCTSGNFHRYTFG